MPRQPESIEDQIANLRRWNRTLVKSVQAVAATVGTLASEVAHHSEVIDRLNGSVDAIHQIKEIAPKLVRLSEQLDPDIVTQVVALASQQKEKDDWWAGTRKRLNPFKPVGAVFWTILTGVTIWILGTLAVDILTRR